MLGICTAAIAAFVLVGCVTVKVACMIAKEIWRRYDR